MAAALTLYELAAADPALRFSPHCWKVRMALAHKGLEAERVPRRFTEKDAIDFSGQERGHETDRRNFRTAPVAAE